MPGTVLNTVQMLTQCLLTIYEMEWSVFHFRDKKTWAQRDYVAQSHTVKKQEGRDCTQVSGSKVTEDSVLLSTTPDAEVWHSKWGEEWHIVSAIKKSKNPTTAAICDSLAPTQLRLSILKEEILKYSENTPYI